MLSVAYNNLGVALFGLGLETDLPALRLLAERAVATAELAAVAPGTVSSRTRLAHRPRLNAFCAAGGDLPTSHAAVFRDNAAVINERTGRQAPPRCVLPALAFGQPSAALIVRVMCSVKPPARPPIKRFGSSYSTSRPWTPSSSRGY